MHSRILFVAVMALAWPLCAHAQFLTPDDLGQALMESVKAKDFDRLKSCLPDKAGLKKLTARDGKEMNDEQIDKLRSGQIVPKIEGAFQDILDRAGKKNIDVSRLSIKNTSLKDLPGMEQQAFPPKMLSTTYTYDGKDGVMEWLIVQVSDSWYLMDITLTSYTFNEIVPDTD